MGIKLRNWSFTDLGPKLIVYPIHLPQALKECKRLMYLESFGMKVMKLCRSCNILSRGLCSALPLLCTPWGCCGPGVWVVNNFGMWPLRHWLRRMFYASPVWWGFIDAGSRNEIEAVIRRQIRLNYLPSQFGLFEELCRKADTALISAVLNDSTHVLNHLLPPVKYVGYNLRPRTHDRCLPGHLSSLQKKNFFNRLLFLDSY